MQKTNRNNLRENLFLSSAQKMIRDNYRCVGKQLMKSVHLLHVWSMPGSQSENFLCRNGSIYASCKNNYPISVNQLGLDAGTFPLWSGNTFWRGDYQEVSNVSHETDHRYLMLGFERVQISEAIDAESRTIEMPSQFSLRNHEVPASLR